MVRAPQADTALSGAAAVASRARALGLGAPGERRSPPRPVLPPPGGQAVPLPSSPVDREGMYRGLLWVAWAVEECSRAYTRLSSRVSKIESRVDLLESMPIGGEGPPRLPEPAHQPAPPPPPSPSVDERTVARIDTLESKLRQLDDVPHRLTDLQRAVEQLEQSEPAPVVEPVAVDEDAEADSSELEAVYQELDRVAEFVAARAEALDAALHELRRTAASNGHDAERRMRELEARLERFERLYSAMQAGLQLAIS